MAALVRAYLRILEKRPMVTMATTTGVQFFLGDVVAQFAVERKSLREYDVPRAARFTVFGFLVAGPVLKTWYGFLEKTIKGTPTVALVKKVGLDQFAFAPSFLGLILASLTLMKTYSVESAADKVQKLGFVPIFYAYMFGTLQLMKSWSLEDSKQKLKQDLKPILFTNWKIWPAVQFVNFYFVPLQHRVLVVNMVALFWNTYLAYMAEREQPAHEEKPLTETH